MSDVEITRAGFATLIGAPNAGKSTLVNALVGSKVSIVTHKVQTTRFSVRGITHFENTQIILVDTPGVFSPRKRLEKAMVNEAWGGVEGASAVIHVVDAQPWVAHVAGKSVSAYARRSMDFDDYVRERLSQMSLPKIVVLNKVDLFAHDKLLPLIAEFSKHETYSAIMPISAENGEGLDALLAEISPHMPEGPAVYAQDQAADVPIRLLASEITREKLLLRLHQELPYQAHVLPELWEERRDGSIEIRQTILIGNKTHKPIILGKNGQTLKAIGQASRVDLEDLLQTRVHLFLHIKVEPDWLTKHNVFG